MEGYDWDEMANEWQATKDEPKNYQSPIEIIWGDIESRLVNDILKVIQTYDIHVDAEELKKALAYDRDQYYKGYETGYNIGRLDGEAVIKRRIREFVEEFDDV